MYNNENFPSYYTLMKVITFSAVTVGFLMWKLRKRKVYIDVGNVKNLFFYPVKSLRRVPVNQLEITPIGVKALGVLDRSFMLVSDNGTLVSQRQEPTLALLSVSVTNDKIVITDPEGKTLKVNISDFDDVNRCRNVIKCFIHDTEIETLDCGFDAFRFFNSFLNRKDVRLVRFVPYLTNRKYTGKEDYFAKFINANPSTFQDLAPVNVLTESSINALNSKLNDKITVNNFRPNVLVATTEAFDEDNWKHLKFSNGVMIDPLLPCGRCIMTTNDPETGVKTNKEPLITLRKFRMLDDPRLPKVLHYSPCFGLNCWVRKPGTIAIGDFVFAVIEKDHVKFKKEKEAEE